MMSILIERFSLYGSYCKSHKEYLLTSKISPTDSKPLSPKSTRFNSDLFWRSESSMASTSLCDKKAILRAGFALNKLPGSDLI